MCWLLLAVIAGYRDRPQDRPARVRSGRVRVRGKRRGSRGRTELRARRRGGARSRRSGSTPGREAPVGLQALSARRRAVARPWRRRERRAPRRRHASDLVRRAVCARPDLHGVPRGSGRPVGRDPDRHDDDDHARRAERPAADDSGRADTVRDAVLGDAVLANERGGDVARRLRARRTGALDCADPFGHDTPAHRHRAHVLEHLSPRRHRDDSGRPQRRLAVPADDARTDRHRAAPRRATARSSSTGSLSFPKIVWNQCPDAVAGNLAVGIDLFMGNGCGSSAQLATWLSGSGFAVGNAQEQAAARTGSIGTFLPDEWDTHLPERLHRCGCDAFGSAEPGLRSRAS